MNKKVFIATLLIVFSSAAPILAGDWANFRGNETHSANISESFNPPLSEKWTFSAGDKIVSSPTVMGDKVVFGSRDNKVYALSKDTGELLWTFSAGGWVDSSTAVANNLVYFSSRDGYFYCLNLGDGTLNWKYQTSGNDSSSPIVSDGKVVFGTGFSNKAIIALDATTGEKVWETETDQMVYSSPAVRDEVVYVGANDGNIYSLNLGDGSVNWKFKANGGFDHVSPAIDEEVLYMPAGNFDWSIYAINLSSGQSVWAHLIEDNQLTPTYMSSAAVGDGRIFVVSGYARQYLYCLRSSDGQQLWKAYLSQATRFGFSSSPVIADNVVYVATAKGKLKAFNASSGSSLWEYTLGADVLSSPAISDGVLYIGTMDGTLYAFD